MCRQLTEFFQGPRYRINQFLLSLNGQWAYQKNSTRNILVPATFCCFFVGLFGQTQNIVVHRRDWLTVLPTFGPYLVHIGCVIKICNSLYYTDKMRQLLERIYDDWHAPMGPEEKVLAQFADSGRLFTLMYTGNILSITRDQSHALIFLVWLYISIVFYLTLSTMPRIMMVNGWANITSGTTLFAIPIYFTANDEDHYILIQSYVCISIVIILTILIAVDGMFVVFIQHGCGIFAAVSYRLEHLIDGEQLKIVLHPRLEDDKPFWTVIDCIKKHKAAIEFANQLASVYSWSFLSMLAINMLAMSFTGLQVMTAATPDSLDEALRQAIFAGSQLLHLFFENLFSQNLTDQSLEVFAAVTRSKWYMCSIRTRVLLQVILMRSAIRWEMKAGKLFTMSMENFSVVLRTSMSYLTILGSMA